MLEVTGKRPKSLILELDLLKIIRLTAEVVIGREKLKFLEVGATGATLKLVSQLL